MNKRKRDIKKTFFVIGIIASIILGIVIVSSGAERLQSNSQKIKIVTTLFPLYDFVKNVGGNKVEVSLLLPPGVEAHSFEPKPGDIVNINEADVFIYTGKSMEPWVDSVIKGASNKKMIIIDASIGIKMIPAVFRDNDEPTGSIDPHIWLDFDNDKIIIQAIAKALSQKDPVNADFYQRNASEYQDKLSALDEEYTTGLSKCKSMEVIYGGHYAFGYLAKRYNLKYLAAQGISPDAEPTANDLIQLIDQIKKDNIQYVFYEELITPKIAEILANETNAKLLLLNAGHNITKDDFENGVSFLSIMEKNLTNLRIGLRCNR